MLKNVFGLFARTRIAALALLLCLVPAALLAQAPAPGRIVAIGDVHGDFDAFTAILQQAGLIDAKLRWSGKNATLVQTGDFLDRGEKCRAVMDLLMALEKQAPRQGGRVVVLLGNHEMMNLMGDLRYADRMYPTFADKNSEKRRKTAYQSFLDWQKARAEALKQTAPAPTPESEAAWMTAHPLGFVEQREAVGSTGKYGRWLRERPAVVQVGTTLFVHGGISPELGGWTLDAIEKRIRSEVKAFDTYKEGMVTRNIILPFFTIEEITAAARAELDARNAEVAQKTAEAAKSGKPADIAGHEKRWIEYLSEFLMYPNWLTVHPAGPLWFRGYTTWSDAEGSPQLAKLLESLGVSQIVVGHSTVKDGRVAARFGGKVFVIDTGMLSSYYNGGRASALEIEAGKFTAIYMDQRVVLLSPARAPEVAAPTVKEEDVSVEVPGGGLLEDWQQPSRPTSSTGTESAQAVAPAPTPHVWLDPEGKPLPFETDEEVMEFLRTAKVVSMKNVPKGITHPRKVLLEKDGLRMAAIFRDIHEEKDMAQMAGGMREMFFRDDFIFECAAYELGRLLGMENIPPVVTRKIGGESGSLQVWLEGGMTEEIRQKDKIRPPEAIRWNRQVQMMRLFDNLIYNTDRNMGNILIDRDWKIWLIDHTRAFRRHTVLQSPQTIVEVERRLWEKVLALDDATIKGRLKPYLRGYEIDALLRRRQKLIEHVRAEIGKRGEREVLYTLQ